MFMNNKGTLSMKRVVIVLLLVALSYGLSSCATIPPKEYQFNNTKTIDKNFDVVWVQVIKWFATNNIPIRTVEKASGFISTEWELRTASKCMDCGTPGGLIHESSDYRINFNVQVEKTSEMKTKVTISLFPYTYWTTAGTQYSAPSKWKVECNSTGKYEKELLYYLSK